MAIWLKKKKRMLIVCLIVLVIVITGIVIIVSNKVNSGEQKIVETTSKQAEVKEETISTTLTALGEVKAANEEKLLLNTSYYYLTMCAEEEEYVEKGGNILQYTNGKYLVAPYDCVLTSYNLPNEGEICTTSHYIEIQSIDSLCMSLSVSENDINKVEIGDLVDITITSTSEKIEGRITSISEVGTYSSNGSYFTAKVSFENTGTLKIGMSATCEIILERAENVVAVPLEAIQTSDDGSYVIVIKEDGTQENVTVETGISNDAYIEIKSGITEKTKVVMSESTSSSSNSSRGGFNFEGGPGGSRNGGNSGSGTQFQGGDMPGGGNRPSI